MLGPLTQNSIIIRERRRCCRSTQFNSDFPPQLTGIIDPNEFFQSIDNINQARKWTLCEKIARFVTTFSVLIGPILLGVGLGLISLKKPAVYIPIICVGAIASLASVFMLIYVSIFVSKIRLKRLHNAVHDESVRYSTKLPTPTKWRINSYTTQNYSGSDGLSTIIHYQLIIDIEKKVNSANGSDRLNEPSSYIV
ncbi:unnamed protein product [Adineta steineri]|uniref:Uncharacterized protein n=1 Tax=Adineta steineri TaxID=433720 RepID=A0A816CPN4_9BILA|nr:unnamed protein product [Adineta steineri]CAF1623890.1 unnamed protein product [Adineta steineri]